MRNWKTRIKDALRPAVESLRRAKREHEIKRSAPPVSRERIVADLRALGLKAGDVVFLHSSLKSIGYVEGGAPAVLSALAEVVSPEGTLIVPTYHMPGGSIVAACREPGYVFDPRKHRTDLGTLPAAFLKFPGVERSIHPTHSVSALGKHAKYVTASHHTAPSIFGHGSPWQRCVELDGKVLGLGISLGPVTFYHLLEDTVLGQFPLPVRMDETFRLPCRDWDGNLIEVPVTPLDPIYAQRRIDTPGRGDLRDYFWRELERAGLLHTGTVGEARSWFINAPEFLAHLRLLMNEGITIYSTPEELQWRPLAMSEPRDAASPAHSAKGNLKLREMARIARDKWSRAGARQASWDATVLSRELVRLFEPANRQFGGHALRDQWQFMHGDIRPVRGEIDRRASAGVRWLLRAQKATADDGVSMGYFPCRAASGGWMPSYPETTGYIITTLLAYAELFDDATARDAALKMARWEIEVQMPSGAVSAGPVGPPSRQTPAAFNTGMVLDGWCSAYRASSDGQVLGAARRAADFLAGDIDADGYFRTNGAYVSAGEIKTYTCLCAWALYRFGQIAGEPRYADLAVRAVEAAVRQQRLNGWFAHNCLEGTDSPHTHTMGYTLQGVLEVGLLAQRADLVDAARRGLDPLCNRIDEHGLLSASMYSDWRAASFSSCLTGNAQIAVVCFRLFEHTGAQQYKDAGDRLTDTLKSLQLLDSPLEGVNGATAGSFPLFGNYMRGGYPNWATKYFVDALMLQRRFG